MPLSLEQVLDALIESATGERWSAVPVDDIMIVPVDVTAKIDNEIPASDAFTSCETL